jgi:hypothetical protein
MGYDADGLAAPHIPGSGVVGGSPADPALRRGGLPFDVDVTDAIRFGGVNDLLVGVRKASLFDVQGKYGRRPYQGGSMWGQAIAGIWQDVFLEAVPTVHITDVFVKPLVDQDTLEADLTIQNDSDHPISIAAADSVFPWISKAGTDMLSAPEPAWTLGAISAVQGAPVSATIPAHASTVVSLTEKVGSHLKFWSPESPNLYGMVCHVRDSSGTVLDCKYTRFGWRQITFQGSRVLLNGQPLIMKGDSWHFIGIPEMSRRYAWAWFTALKQAHLNAVRLHAEPYPPFFLDVADEQGILVLDEDAVWASDGGPKVDDPAFWSDTRTHLTNLILRDRNHPCVFGWSISNELMAVVRGVFHAPQDLQDQVIRYDGIWAGICRQNDPTRVWISADGEDDGGGALPTYVVHYGGAEALQKAAASGKPWGVGEAGPAYYGSPAQIDQQSGDQNAYLSMLDRMDGVAVVSYQNLSDQRKFGADYRSVFNLVWYGLKPLNLGMTDTSRQPAITDGVFFPPFVEGKPGVQPERLGPYCSTLNPGYDPSLPLYQTWPLFDAIRDAQADTQIDFKPGRPFDAQTGQVKDPSAGTTTSVQVLSGVGGTLSQALQDIGAPVTATPAQGHPSLLFVDGAQPPSADAKTTIQRTFDAGGTVFVWGANPTTLPALNALIPYPLELTTRSSTSLVTTGSDPFTAGLTPASLYFSELSPSTILTAGLAGPLIDKATPLLVACDTDWTRWNGRAEMTKTASVLRSERESQPSGVALASLDVGKGRLIVCNLPVAAQTSQAASLDRTLLANMGIVLGAGAAQRNGLDPKGVVTRALACGLFGAASADEATASSIVTPGSGPSIVTGAVVKDHPWTPVSADATGALDLRGLKAVSSQQTPFVYLSFWLYSPKALDNLLLDPHLPNVGLTIGSAAATQLWLNGGAVITHPADDGQIAPTILLQQGWNHLLLKAILTPGSSAHPTLTLQSSQPDYLIDVRETEERP